jgi:DNA-3-methyladenine glycosylase
MSVKQPSFRSNILSVDFYADDTTIVARALLGKILVHETPQGIIAGKIVETEAYLMDDPACHAHAGRKTPRTTVMFGPAGMAYIYMIYGMHQCFNVVTGAEGCGEAVLIRALEPVCGIEWMQVNRNQTTLRNMCSGPGKLVRAMGIHSALNARSLMVPPLYIAAPETQPEALRIVTTTRIGISRGVDLPLRFYIKDNPFISKK